MIIGIDLGTTNSAAAVWREDSARLVPNSLGDLLTPSAVAIGEDGSILVGLAVRERMVVDPSAAATLFKRTMGTDKSYRLGRKKYTSEELSSLVLRALVDDVEAHLGERPERAVITVPAYFNDKQRKATRRAGELAGLRVERLINEPTAAAPAYGIHELDEEKPFLVFDLGGGTFDVSIVEIFDGVIEVRSTAGDNRLGGEDFNRVLADLALERLGRADLTVSTDPRLAEVVRDAAERARRALTDAEEAELGFVWNGLRHCATIGTGEFEQAAEQLVERLREPVIRSLRDGGVKVGDLSEIVMVGGATRMPLVRRAATRMFGRFPETRINPDQAVALGAAIQAALRQKDEAFREIRLTDVCPFTLGVESAEPLPNGGFRTGVFAPIIERNTVVPCSRMEVFSTLQHGQRMVEFAVYQGESRMVAENVALGKVRVKVPMRRAGKVQVECRFSYDSSGLLEVDVSVPETGTAKQLVIVGDSDMSAEKLAKRRAELGKLKFHPREDSANAAVLARARRCYEAHLGDTRIQVGGLISQFETALDSQDPRAVADARAEVVSALDALEGERFL